jgi:hypothetical protein
VGPTEEYQQCRENYCTGPGAAAFFFDRHDSLLVATRVHYTLDAAPYPESSIRWEG